MSGAILFFFLLQYLLLECSTTKAISVNSITGDDSACGIDSETPCRTIKTLMEKIQGQSNVSIVIETDIYLSSEIRFENVSFISISGHLSQNSHHQNQKMTCKKEAGILVNNVTNFTVTNLNISKCGIFRGEYNTAAAVIFNRSADIELRYVTVSEGLSGLAFLACSESVRLEYVHVYKNGNQNLYYCNPVGVKIEITLPDKSANYVLRHMNFHRNKASKCYDIYGVTEYGGGALGIFFRLSSVDNSVKLFECNFSENNASAFGGGLYVGFWQYTYNNSVIAESVNFMKNKALKGGGGVRVFFLNRKNLQYRTNQVAFHDVHFYNNFAKYGGGSSISAAFSHFRYSYDTKSISVCFYNCTWKRNEAVFGAAVDITPFNEGVFERSGFLPNTLFHNATFTENFVVSGERLKKTLHANAGVFTITQFTVYFQKSINLSYNNYTALYLTSAHVIVDETASVYFQYNRGENGGAIAMYGFSLLSIYGNTSLKFINNTATNTGGAIFYQISNQFEFISGSSCFIRFAGKTTLPVAKRNVSFLFSYNTATNAGNSIYADTFEYCKSSCIEYRNMTDFLKCFGNVTFVNKDSSEFKSSGRYFQFQDRDKGLYDLIPGKKYNIPFNVVDEFDNVVHPLLSLSSFPTTAIKIDPSYAISGDFTAKGKPGNAAQVTFSAQNVRRILFKFNITTQNCPPGFYFEGNTCHCSTSKEFYPAISDCNLTTFQANMKVDYWAGYIPLESNNHTDLYFAPCFPPLCITSFKSIHLPDVADNSEVSSIVCGQYRNGIMCGKCVENTSVLYHSRYYACAPNHLCQFGLLFYIISELLPMTLLFFIIVIFDVNFSSGNLVGFVFFAQQSSLLHISEKFEKLWIGSRIFYGIFNFEYFTVERLSFCLWENFQILSIITFKYITVILAFGLVLIFVSLLRSNRCTKLWKWRTKLSYKTSFVHGLSAFLIICYNQCTQTSFLILKDVTPEGFEGRRIQTYSYYGGLPFFHFHHLMYAIPALFSLVVVTILPPLVLLLYPLSLQFLSLCGLSEHWIVNKILNVLFINKLKPFIDSFQSCYKDKFRFFAGLYFAYRVAILCCFSLSETYNGYRISSGLLLLSILGIHSVVQPYKNHVHNMIDSLIFFNLILINVLAVVGNYGGGHSGSNLVTSVLVIAVYLPMAVFLTRGVMQLFSFLRPRWRREKKRYVTLINDASINERDRMIERSSESSSMMNYGSI